MLTSVSADATACRPEWIDGPFPVCAGAPQVEMMLAISTTRSARGPVGADLLFVAAKSTLRSPNLSAQAPAESAGRTPSVRASTEAAGHDAQRTLLPFRDSSSRWYEKEDSA